MKWGVLLIVVLLIPAAHGVILRGIVYDFSLNPTTAVVTVESPRQVMVAQNGDYSFTLEPGEYVLTAEVRSRNELVEGAQEIVIVNADTNLDLILLENFEDDAIPDLDVVLEFEEERELSFWYWLVAFGVGAIGWRLIKKKSLKEHAQPTHQPPEMQLAPRDHSASQVLDFIYREKRTTQKEIRRQFPSSEAKISLILSQLESEGKIRKIKMGRGNVIVSNNDGTT